MKRITLFLGILLLGTTITLAQNPYKTLGVDIEPLTLSKGKFVEFFPNDSLVQIGSVILDTRTNSIVSFVVVDTAYSEATLEPELTVRFLQPDPLAALYPNVSPYVYTANNPVNAIDPDGRLVVYVNGFRPDAYKFYAASKIPNSPHRGISAPWVHNQGIYNKDVFNYWGEFSDSFSSRIGDDHQIFVDGMYRPHSTGGDRYARGYKDGQKLAKQILSGKVDLNGETIKLVGHSHGGAHAAGMAEALLEAGLPVETIFLFAPHQPDQFGVHYGVGASYQFSRTGDHVSSNQSKLGIGQIFVGGSEFSSVSGISRLIEMQNGNTDGLGNHSIQTYTDMSQFREEYPELYKQIFGEN